MAADKPNILVIIGDDIGWFNPSIYHRGMMGYRTPAGEFKEFPPRQKSSSFNVDAVVEKLTAAVSGGT